VAIEANAEFEKLAVANRSLNWTTCIQTGETYRNPTTLEFKGPLLLLARRDLPDSKVNVRQELRVQVIPGSKISEIVKEIRTMMKFDSNLRAVVRANAYTLGWRPQSGQTGPARISQAALEILKVRYAGQEITRTPQDTAAPRGQSRDARTKISYQGHYDQRRLAPAG